MIRTAFYPVAALTGLVLASSSILHAGSLEPSSGKKPKSSGPSVTTYATGLTNPRGLAFGPDGNLYVAEAGVGGGQTPADIDPGCPVDVNIYSPYTAGYSGRVTRVRADGTTETVAADLPSMTDAYGGSYGPTDVAFVDGQAVRADRDGRLLARDARRPPRDPAGQPRWVHDQRGQPQRVARGEPAALHQGHRSGDHRPGTGRRVPFDDRARQVPLRGRDQPRLPATCRSVERHDREAL